MTSSAVVARHANSRFAQYPCLLQEENKEVMDRSKSFRAGGAVEVRAVSRFLDSESRYVLFIDFSVRSRGTCCFKISLFAARGEADLVECELWSCELPR